MSFWIFKCDPKRYRLAQRLTDPNPTLSWLVTRYKKEIALGDTVFLLETGPKRTLRAVLRVEAGPQDMVELPGEQAYWVERDTEIRCRIVGTITLRTDLAVEKLLTVEGLQDMTIFHGVQQGTNFRVSDDEGQLLLSLLERAAGQN